MSDAVPALPLPGIGLHLLSGPNGSGKSWAARALAARTPGAQLLSPESQQAFYEAELAADESDFIGEGIDSGTTVAELLGEAAVRHRLFGALRLEGLWTRGYRLLSSGESRKVLLLRALLPKPPLVVLDEPFDGLDAASVQQLAEALVELASETAVLLIGGFRPDALPFSTASVRSVTVIEQRQVSFSGDFEAWRQRHVAHASPRRSPPVELGNFYEPPPAQEPLVRLVNGRVAYGDQIVFEGLDFSVLPGQHTLIEGPNGSGKSTLVDMCTGDHPQAYSNELYLFGRRRGTGETVWDIKQNIGAVSGRLHRDYRVDCSVEDALISGLYDSIGVYRAREPSERARALAWLHWLELAAKPSTSFRALSFGEQRLVLIARAAIKVPPLVVLDEPTSGLDPENQSRVLDLVTSLCSQQKSTVLFVTHRPDEREFWRTHIRGAHLRLGRRTA